MTAASARRSALAEQSRLPDALGYKSIIVNRPAIRSAINKGRVEARGRRARVHEILLLGPARWFINAPFRGSLTRLLGATRRDSARRDATAAGTAIKVSPGVPADRHSYQLALWARISS